MGLIGHQDGYLVTPDPGALDLSVLRQQPGHGEVLRCLTPTTTQAEGSRSSPGLVAVSLHPVAFENVQLG